jgi:hypothetical protein
MEDEERPIGIPPGAVVKRESVRLISMAFRCGQRESGLLAATRASVCKPAVASGRADRLVTAVDGQITADTSLVNTVVFGRAIAMCIARRRELRWRRLAAIFSRINSAKVGVGAGAAPGPVGEVRSGSNALPGGLTRLRAGFGRNRHVDAAQQ